MIKKFVFLSALMGMLFSCENRFEYFNSINEPPKINIFKKGLPLTIARDSIKKSQENLLIYYDLELYVEDFNKNFENIRLNESELNRYFVQTKGENNILIANNINDLKQEKKDTIILKLAFYEAGEHPLSFMVFDKFGKRNTKSITIDALRNKPPVVNYLIKYDRTQEGIFTLDLSNSFDRDENIGGEIVSYTAIIKTDTLEKRIPIINYYFSDEGIYPVQVYTTDNNGENSAIKNFEIHYER